MRVAVLGADGFLGRSLVARLAQSSSVTINAFSHFSSLLREDPEEHPFTKLKNVTIIPGDFHNRDEVEAAVKGCDYVFHLVTSTTPASSSNDPFIDIETNVRNTIQLLTICSENEVKRVIYFSSGGAVYGDVDSDNIRETDNLHPISPYGIGKATTEYFLDYFRHAHGLDYLIYRVANPYGPGQKVKGKQGVITIFMNHLLENEPITIYGDGEMVRDYIYIDDFIAMVAASYDKKAKHHVYNIGSGKGTSVNTLVKVIEVDHHTKFKKQYKETPPTFVRKNVLNIDRFVNEFHVTPQTSLEEGMERTWKYVREIS